MGVIIESGPRPKDPNVDMGGIEDDIERTLNGQNYVLTAEAKEELWGLAQEWLHEVANFDDTMTPEGKRKVGEKYSQIIKTMDLQSEDIVAAKTYLNSFFNTTEFF